MAKFRRWISLLAPLLLCIGCVHHRPYTWAPFKLSDAGWTVWNGQAIWKPRPSIPELTGDVVLAVNTNGNAFVQFTKTLPFATARLSAAHWQIDFPQNRLYSGKMPPPAYFAWLQLPALVEHRPLTAHWETEGDLSQFSLHNPRTGETLRGYLTPP